VVIPPWTREFTDGMAFCARLRRARITAGLSQEALAERAGLTTNAVGALEREEHRYPYPATIRALATALGMTEAEHAELAASVPPRWGREVARPHRFASLPSTVSSIVGRAQEIATILSLLRAENGHLVTLTGPGGVGKTRLALSVGEHLRRDLPDGVLFVDLSSTRDPALLLRAIAEGLGISGGNSPEPFTALTSTLGRRPWIVILDNLEQLVTGTPVLSQLLAVCPTLRFLVTSRTLLRLAGEQVVVIQPLGLPDRAAVSRPADLAAAPAIRLFVERAQQVAPDFQLTPANAATVAAICQRLDGLPLAIELAAAQLRHVPPAMLLARLAHRLPLLTMAPRDQPARQATMRDTIAWSHDLLSPEQHICFRRLAICSGSFSLEAAAAITADGERAALSGAMEDRPGDIFHAIGALIDASLLQATPTADGIPRFRMLETIREYGLEQLRVAGEEAQTQDEHARYFGNRDEGLDPNHLAPGERFDDRLWHIELDYPNLRATLGHLMARADAQGVLRLAGAMAIFWHHRGHLEEGERWLEWALTRTSDRPSLVRAQAYAGLSLVLWSQGSFERAHRLAETSLAMASVLDDAELTALSIHLRGIAEIAMGHFESAEVSMTDALSRWRTLALPSNAAMAMLVLSLIAFLHDDLIAARRYADDALALFRGLAHSSGTLSILVLQAELDAVQGNHEGSALAHREALTLWEDVDERWSAVMDDQPDRQALVFPRWAGIQDRRSIVGALVGLAEIAADHEQPDKAAMLLGAVNACIADMGEVNVSTFITSRRNRGGEQTRRLMDPARFSTFFAHGGTLPLSEAIAIAMTVVTIPATQRNPVQGPFGTLSVRETEVLLLLAQRWSNREIADALFLSPRTVSTHVHHIFTKLGVRSRREAAAFVRGDNEC